MWYYQEGSQASRPHSIDDLGHLIGNGTVKPDTLVWSTELSGWTAAKDIAALSRYFTPTPPPLPLSQAKAPNNIELKPREFTTRELEAITASKATAWGRYFARMIDINVLGLGAMFGVGFAAAMFHPETYIAITGINEGLVSLLAIILAQALIALSMTIFGTTPGKAIVGLKVLPFVEKPGLVFYGYREARIWLAGLALGIPLFALFTMSHQFGRIKRGEEASYDVGLATVVARPKGQRINLGLIVWLLIIAFTVWLTVLGHHDERAARTLKDWTNPLTNQSTRILQAWEEQPVDAENVVYLAANAILAEAIIGYEELGFDDVEEYGEALRAGLASDVTITGPWRRGTLDGREVIEASATHNSISSVNILVTVSRSGDRMWRTLLFASGRKVPAHTELMEFRRQAWSTIPQ